MTAEHKPHSNPLVEIIRHALYRGHQVDSENWDWQPADTALSDLVEQLAVQTDRAQDYWDCWKRSEAQYEDAMGNWHDCKEAHRSLLEQLEADVESFRLIAMVCGADGTEPDEWRAMTFPHPRAAAFDAALRLRSNYDETLASSPASRPSE